MMSREPPRNAPKGKDRPSQGKSKNLLGGLSMEKGWMSALEGLSGRGRALFNRDAGVHLPSADGRPPRA